MTEDHNAINIQRIADALAAANLGSLVNIRNPLDLNPMADELKNILIAGKNFYQ